jgi:hypothetical protein
VGSHALVDAAQSIGGAADAAVCVLTPAVKTTASGFSRLELADGRGVTAGNTVVDESDVDGTAATNEDP